MITSRRDYLLRILDEVSRLLARVIFKRRSGANEEALQAVVQACERLFALEADKLFQFTPEQHRLMLTEGESVEDGRVKLLIYAALNAEAGQIYAQLGRRPLARASFLNALRLTLEVQRDHPGAALPDFTPNVEVLLANLADSPLDEATANLCREVRGRTAP